MRALNPCVVLSWLSLRLRFRVKRKYEQRQQKYYQSIRLTQPPGQFIPPQPPLGLEEKSSDNRSDGGSKSAANLIGRDVGLEISDLGTQDGGVNAPRRQR